MIGFATKTDLEMGNYQGHVPANLRKQNDTRKVQNLSLFTVKTVVSRALISLLSILEHANAFSNTRGSSQPYLSKRITMESSKCYLIVQHFLHVSSDLISAPLLAVREV